MKTAYVANPSMQLGGGWRQSSLKCSHWCRTLRGEKIWERKNFFELEVDPPRAWRCCLVSPVIRYSVNYIQLINEGHHCFQRKQEVLCRSLNYWERQPWSAWCVKPSGTLLTQISATFQSGTEPDKYPVVWSARSHSMRRSSVTHIHIYIINTEDHRGGVT